MQFHIDHPRALLAILFTVFALRLAAAQPLSVSPAFFDLGRFPAWKAQAQTFTIRNIGESTVNLLRVRSSCSCLAADFQPCALASGQETSLTVTIAANSVSGDFSKAVFLENRRAGTGVFEADRLRHGGPSGGGPSQKRSLSRTAPARRRANLRLPAYPRQPRNVPPTAAARGAGLRKPIGTRAGRRRNLSPGTPCPSRRLASLRPRPASNRHRLAGRSAPAFGNQGPLRRGGGSVMKNTVYWRGKTELFRD